MAKKDKNKLGTDDTAGVDEIGEKFEGAVQIEGVEMTTEYESSGVVVEISLGILVEHPMNTDLYGQTAIDYDMVRSIRENGVLQPLLVRHCGYEAHEGHSLYMIVAGHRRAFNAREAGLVTVPCIIKEYESMEQVESDLLVSNLQRVKTNKERRNEFLAMKKITRELAQIAKESRRSADGKLLKSPQGTNVPAGQMIGETLGMSRREIQEKTILWDDEYLKNQFKKWENNLLFDPVMNSATFQKWTAIRNEAEEGVITDSAGAKKVKELIAETDEKLASLLKPKKEKPVPFKSEKSIEVNAGRYANTRDNAFAYLMEFQTQNNADGLSNEAGAAFMFDWAEAVLENQ